MSAEPPTPEGLRATFQELLNRALTRGRVAPGSAGLGPSTLAAVNAVALEHPDADAELIADAYDVFEREHGTGGGEWTMEHTSCWE
jgi:hypothetical protein